MPRVGARALFMVGLAYVALPDLEIPVRADLVYIRNGGEAQLPATIADSRVILDMPLGKIELARADIRLLVPGFWPEAEWPSRRKQAQAASLDARLATIWWAIENGLTSEAATELRELHAIDLKHGTVRRMVAVLDRLDRPCADPEFGRFQKALAVPTRIARGPHVILLHQHSDQEADERITLLERVITGFYLSFAAQGIELSVPSRRLVSAWIADQKDYLAFLRSEDATAFATTRGYFHPTWNAVVAYDARSNEDQRIARTKLASRRDESRKYGELVDGSPAKSRVKIKLADQPPRTVSRAEAREFLARTDREITCELMLLDLEWRSIDLGTAAHEMIHQLASESGLVPRHDAFPVWMHEGLAAQFEVIRGGRWAGISRAHELRLPDWRKVQSPLRLERLVRDAGFGRGYQRDLYAQAWALVYFLRTQRPEQFLTFIDLLRSGGREDAAPTASTRERAWNAFQRAFGPDVNLVEDDWLKFMKTVRTPLEQHAPTKEPASNHGRIRPASPN